MTSAPRAAGRCLGLIGGLGVGATIHYYKALTAAHEARGRAARLLIAHADVERVLGDIGAGRVDELAQYLASLVRQLADGGAEVAAIAAIAPHIAAPRLVPLCPLPLVDLAEATARAVRAAGLQRVALFGTRAAMTSGLFGRLTEVEVVQPRPDELAYIQATYLAIVRAAGGTADQIAGLRKLADTLCRRDGAEAIVLAGTELALVFDEATAG
ncbi:MAG: aspartate/glutamate racemase family protein, partial [Proteobacteria bacterium]|nr:aspartate/glutamate racemase family protein [Pseudomonadota bacterium]